MPSRFAGTQSLACIMRKMMILIGLLSGFPPGRAPVKGFARHARLRSVKNSMSNDQPSGVRPTGTRQKKITLPRKEKTSRLFVPAIGALFIVGLIVLLVFIPSPTDQQFTAIRIALALASGCVTMLITGAFNL